MILRLDSETLSLLLSFVLTVNGYGQTSQVSKQLQIASVAPMSWLGSRIDLRWVVLPEAFLSTAAVAWPLAKSILVTHNNSKIIKTSLKPILLHKMIHFI